MMARLVLLLQQQEGESRRSCKSPCLTDGERELECTLEVLTALGNGSCAGRPRKSQNCNHTGMYVMLQAAR